VLLGCSQFVPQIVPQPRGLPDPRVHDDRIGSRGGAADPPLAVGQASAAARLTGPEPPMPGTGDLLASGTERAKRDYRLFLWMTSTPSAGYTIDSCCSSQ
jgi:hypothetical protein